MRRKKITLVKTLLEKCKQHRGLHFQLQHDLKVSRKFLLKCHENNEDNCLATKKRKDAQPDETKKITEDFYNRGDITKINPTTKTVSKKTMQPTRYMETTLTDAHRQFSAENPNVKVSFSTFAALKPGMTKTSKNICLNTCCCEYCCNIDLKTKAINGFCLKKGMPDKVLPCKSQLADMTVRNTPIGTHYPKRGCLDRAYDCCGPEAVRQHLMPLPELYPDELVKWQKWATNASVILDKSGKEKTINRKMLLETEGPLDQLLEELQEGLSTFAVHLFIARWQHQMYSGLTHGVPQKWLVTMMDFGENFTCYFQNEAQAAHWTQSQVTVHPIVTFYRCPDDDIITKESFVFISDDLKHDSNAVHHFTCLVVQRLMEQGLVFQKMVHFSDGCTSQYKGKTCFVDISFSETDMGIISERHFFGSRHGKSVCDGEIGIVKRSAALAIRAGTTVISNATDLHSYCARKLTLPSDNTTHSHNRRTVVYVPMGAIQRDRQGQTSSEIKTVPGTLSVECCSTRFQQGTSAASASFVRIQLRHQIEKMYVSILISAANGQLTTC